MCKRPIGGEEEQTGGIRIQATHGVNPHALPRLWHHIFEVRAAEGVTYSAVNTQGLVVCEEEGN